MIALVFAFLCLIIVLTCIDLVAYQWLRGRVDALERRMGER